MIPTSHPSGVTSLRRETIVFRRTSEEHQPYVRKKKERERGRGRKKRSSLRYDNGDYNERSQSLSYSPVLTPPINTSGFQRPDRRYKRSYLGKEQNEKRGRGKWGSWRIAARMTARDQLRWHYDSALVDIFWGANSLGPRVPVRRVNDRFIDSVSSCR